MSTKPLARILVVADLHLTSESTWKNWLKVLEDIRATDDTRPNAILVAGDLTQNGKPEEFDRAAVFLTEMAASLKLESNAIFVVPGISDIDETSNRYFETFYSSMKQFNSPKVDQAGQINASIVSLSIPVHGDAYVDICCLISPTLHGATSRERELLMTHFPPGTKTDRTLSAVGQQQLDSLRDHFSRNANSVGRIRIVLMHNPPLPSKPREYRPFESIFDMGNFLSAMAELEVDLVICGCTHKLHLSHYRQGQAINWIDVLETPTFSESGSTDDSHAFLLIDLFGPQHSPWATIRPLSTVTGEPILKTLDLYRELSWPDFVSQLWQAMPRDKRRAYLKPALTTLTESILFPNSWDDMKPQQKDVWRKSCLLAMDTITKDCEHISKGCLTFRGVDALKVDTTGNSKWRRFLAQVWDASRTTHPQNTVFLRILSDWDIDFWKKAFVSKTAEHDYALPVHELDCSKARIIILPDSLAESPENERRALLESVRAMLEDRFQLTVLAVYKSVSEMIINRDRAIQDFSVMGEICVSRWQGMDYSGPRDLLESFDGKDVKRCFDAWEELSRMAFWSSQKHSLETLGESLNLRLDEIGHRVV